MKTQISTLGQTQTSRSYPWGLNTRCGHRLMCSDGKIRAAELAESPDTHFSCPARIRIKGKSISGYMCQEERYSDDYTKTYRVYAFRQHDDQKEKSGLPDWGDISARPYLEEMGETI